MATIRGERAVDGPDADADGRKRPKRARLEKRGSFKSFCSLANLVVSFISRLARPSMCVRARACCWLNGRKEGRKKWKGMMQKRREREKATKDVDGGNEMVEDFEGAQRQDFQKSRTQDVKPHHALISISYPFVLSKVVTPPLSSSTR